LLKNIAKTLTLPSILESEKSSTTLLLPHLLPAFFFFSYSSIWPELDQSFFKATNLQTCFLVKNFLRLGGELIVNLCFSPSILSLFFCQLSIWYQSLVATFHLHGDGVLGAWILAEKMDVKSGLKGLCTSGEVL
jgi:hypothetical protein